MFKKVLLVALAACVCSGMAANVYAANPKVSVIIPVYNSRAWLEKCVKSVAEQTLQEIEVICVNDGSTDGSDKILAKLAQTYNAYGTEKIKVINQANGGASAARNAGLDAATGEYVGFVDSDDWISPKTYENIYNLTSSNGSDVGIFGAWCTRNKTAKSYQGPTRTATYQDRDCFTFLFPPNGSANVWDKIYKRALIEQNKVRFDTTIRCSQDAVFNTILSQFVTKVTTLKEPLYHYERRGTGLVATTGPEELMAETTAGIGLICSALNPDELLESGRLHGMMSWLDVMMQGVLTRSRRMPQWNASIDMQGYYSDCTHIVAHWLDGAESEVIRGEILQKYRKFWAHDEAA